MPCRHERHFLGDITQRRSRHAINARLTVAADASLVCCKQVKRRSELMFDTLIHFSLHEFDMHARAVYAVACDRMVRRDVHRWERSVGGLTVVLVKQRWPDTANRSRQSGILISPLKGLQ